MISSLTLLTCARAHEMHAWRWLKIPVHGEYPTVGGSLTAHGVTEPEARHGDPKSTHPKFHFDIWIDC